MSLSAQPPKAISRVYATIARTTAARRLRDRGNSFTPGMVTPRARTASEHAVNPELFSDLRDRVVGRGVDAVRMPAAAARRLDVFRHVVEEDDPGARDAGGALDVRVDRVIGLAQAQQVAGEGVRQAVEREVGVAGG